jgi:hypothetical protein
VAILLRNCYGKAENGILRPGFPRYYFPVYCNVGVRKMVFGAGAAETAVPPPWLEIVAKPPDAHRAGIVPIAAETPRHIFRIVMGTFPPLRRKRCRQGRPQRRAASPRLRAKRSCVSFRTAAAAAAGGAPPGTPRNVTPEPL